MNGRFMLLVCAGLACAMSAQAETTEATWPVCPMGDANPPAISATGPYLIENWGTTEAVVKYLPNCATVAQELETIERGVPGVELVAVIRYDLDIGTYEVMTAPRS